MADKENGAGPKSGTAQPETTTASSHHNHRTACVQGSNTAADRERQRVAWRRRPWLACGCSDVCRCEWRNEPTLRRVDGYRAAVEHLAELGYPGAALLPECRKLWQRGGSDRRIAETLVSRWSA